MKSLWLPYDDSLDHSSRKEIVNLLRIFLYIIPGIAVILASIDFIFGYTNIALTTLTVPVFCGASMIFLNRGNINTAMAIITSVIIIATSVICFFGSGIHEVGIVIFPVIVFFSSLLMNTRGVIITFSIVVVCLGLIILEEQLNLLPKSNHVVTWIDLMVMLTVLIIHTFITYSFSSITKDNLHRIRKELRNQERYKEEISGNLEEKTGLLRLVHHRVKNNLLLINSLIELEAYQKPEIKEEFKEITDSIHTIARAHDPLYHTDDYKQVSIKPYLGKLVTSLVQSNAIKGIEIHLEDCLVFHEKALLLGIVAQKILTSISSLELHDLQINLVSNADELTFEILTRNENALILKNTSLVELLVDKLNGTFEINPNKLSLSFPVNNS